MKKKLKIPAYFYAIIVLFYTYNTCCCTLHIFFFFFFPPIESKKFWRRCRIHTGTKIYKEEEEELFRELFEDAWKCIMLSRIVNRSNGIADIQARDKNNRAIIVCLIRF